MIVFSAPNPSYSQEIKQLLPVKSSFVHSQLFGWSAKNCLSRSYNQSLVPSLFQSDTISPSIIIETLQDCSFWIRIQLKRLYFFVIWHSDFAMSLQILGTTLEKSASKYRFIKKVVIFLLLLTSE